MHILTHLLSPAGTIGLQLYQTIYVIMREVLDAESLFPFVVLFPLLLRGAMEQLSVKLVQMWTMNRTPTVWVSTRRPSTRKIQVSKLGMVFNFYFLHSNRAMLMLENDTYSRRYKNPFHSE